MSIDTVNNKNHVNKRIIYMWNMLGAADEGGLVSAISKWRCAPW